jgi:RNA polymerase sigma factor (sigma-70 family)
MAGVKSMPNSPLMVAIQHRLADLGPDGAGAADGELLARFLSGRDDDALAALVRRHAPMVWGVCRRRLRNRHDAEDAFQATFLVLVRKAAGVPRQAVAGWLHGVARQTAVRQRAAAAKRGQRESQVADMPEPTAADARDADWRAALDEELGRLPDHYRGVVVLCDLEGLTRREAARHLGIPEGSVASRLARARALLARRLTRRGVAYSGSSVAALLSAGSASAAPPPALVASTIKAASLLAAGQAAGAASATVAALTEGVLKAMFATKLKTAAVCLAAVLVAGFALGGIGLGVVLSANPAAVAQEKTSDRAPAKDNGTAPPAATKEDGQLAVVKAGDQTPKMDFDFHKQVSLAGLKVELSPGSTAARKAVGLATPLVLALKVTNASPQDIGTTLAHEWDGGLPPRTALYASVTPEKEKEPRAFAPVCLAGKGDAAKKDVTLAAGKAMDLDLRMDWPGTGSVIAVPLIQKPGKYVVRVALVFEAGGKRQYAVSTPTEVEYKAEQPVGKADRPATGRPAGLEVAIAVPRRDGERRIAAGPGRHFHVVLTNRTGESIRLWTDGCSNGYDSLALEIDTGRGQAWEVRRAPRNWTSNTPSALELLPGEQVVQDVTFGPGEWELPAAPNPPGGVVRMRAVYRNRLTDSGPGSVMWSGEAASAWSEYAIQVNR